MPKLAGKPVDDKLVGSDILTYGIREVEKTFRNALYAALGIEGFALMHLLECMVYTICFALSVGQLDVECT